MRPPLAFRTQHAWPFVGFGIFTAVNLFGCGLYLLSEAINNPRGTSEAGIVTGAFLLALASFVFSYVVRPRAKALFDKTALIDDAEGQPHETTQHPHGRPLARFDHGAPLMRDQQQLPPPM